MENRYKEITPLMIWALTILCIVKIKFAPHPWSNIITWADQTLTPYRFWRRELTISITLLSVCLLLLIRSLWRWFNVRPIYLMDMACFRPPHILRSPHATFLEHCKISGLFNDQSLEFQKKILERSGLGQSTYFPLCFRYLPPNASVASAREEAETVLCTAMGELITKSGICTKDIGIVVVNCSTFNPTPSLSSMIVNRFKLNSNVKTYDLGGMGCTASVIAIDFVKYALQAYNNTYAIVLSTENITQNWYWGNNKAMLVTNCLFRVGGAAILLSNRPSDKKRAKYKLQHIVRTHMAGDDAAYYSAYQKEDDEGNVGVLLSKDLMRVAAEALKINTRNLGPLVLPYSEQLRFLANQIRRKISRDGVAPYVPDFRKAFRHFCIHSGGKAVLAAVEKGLNLTSSDMEPSRMTLHRFGNTSVSTTWYQFQYLECMGKMKKGDRIWQIAFGTGFKCSSATWIALKSAQGPCVENAWSDTISQYPVALVDVEEL